MLRKIGIWFGTALAVYLVFKDPVGAAGVVNAVADGILTAANAFGAFGDALVEGT